MTKGHELRRGGKRRHRLVFVMIFIFIRHSIPSVLLALPVDFSSALCDLSLIVYYICGRIPW